MEDLKDINPKQAALFPTLQIRAVYQINKRKQESPCWVSPDRISPLSGIADFVLWVFHYCVCSVKAASHYLLSASWNFIMKSIDVQRVCAPPPSRSPDSVWHSLGLVTVALAVARVLRPAVGPLVPPQSHGTMSEHWNSLGDPPAGSAMEQCDNGEFLKVFSDTAGFQWNSGEDRGPSGPESRLHINLKTQQGCKLFMRALNWSITSVNHSSAGEMF